jgi:hypothetical protein
MVIMVPPVPPMQESAPKELLQPAAIPLEEQVASLRKLVRRLESRIEKLAQHTHATLGGAPVVHIHQSWD